MLPQSVLRLALGLVCVFSCHVTWCKEQFVFFLSPGGGAEELAGLYGGKLDNNAQGEGQNLYEFGFNCVFLDEVNSHYKTSNGLQIGSMAFDPVSNRVLIQLAGNSHLTLLRGPITAKLKPCTNETEYLEPLFLRAQVQDKMGPFAYYNKVIYFIYNTVETIDTRWKKAKVELRKVTGCKMDWPVTATESFDVEECSKAVATLAESDYERLSTLRPTDHLLAIHTHRGPQFLTQLEHLSYEDDVILANDTFALTMVAADGKVKVVHTEEVRKDITFNIEHKGGLDYKDGRLCWTAVDKLLCADWDREDVSNVETVLDPSQGDYQCKGIPGEPITAQILTGVAIAQVSPEFIAYFGCFANRKDIGGDGYEQFKDVGGAGVVHKMADGSLEMAVISSKKPTSGHVFAGTILAVDPFTVHEKETSGGSYMSTTWTVSLFAMAVFQLFSLV